MIHSYLLNFVYGTPWALLPEKLAVIVDLARRHAAGETLEADEVQAIVEAAQRNSNGARQAGAIAVLPIAGTIIPHGDMLMESSGAMSCDRIAALFHAALADPSVAGIVLNVDSPGGSVQGVDELAADLYKSRGQKPVVAIANHLAASAAYWIATSADELVVTPSSEVGSVGVFAAHDDLSAAQEQMGVKTTLISAGKYKTEASPFGPLSDEAKAAIQSRVDDYYGMFTKAVARNRGVNVSDVRGGFGEGRVVGAKEAVASGMADRIDTLDGVITRMAKGMKAGTSAEFKPLELSAKDQAFLDTQAGDLEFRHRRARAASKR